MIQLTGSRIHEMAHECGPDPRHVAEYVGRVAEALSLLDLPHTPAIVVAGSVAHNTCTSASDLDIQVKLPYSTLAHSDTMKLDWVGFNATVAESLAGGYSR